MSNPGSDTADDVVVDGDGNVVVVGAVVVTATNSDMFLAQVHRFTGAELWRRQIDVAERSDVVVAATLDGEQNVVAVGREEVEVGGRFAVWKLDAVDGSDRWRYRPSDAEAVALSGGVNAAGDVVAAGVPWRRPLGGEAQRSVRPRRGESRRRDGGAGRGRRADRRCMGGTWSALEAGFNGTWSGCRSS